MLQPVTGFRVGCIGGPAQEIRYGELVSFGIRRREFDDFLLKRSGARLLLGAALVNLDRKDKQWVANECIKARIVIGAGGHFCPVARRLGAKVGAEAAVVAQESEFEMDARQLAGCPIRGDTPEFYFCPDLEGYGWCFRKRDILNVGLGSADPRHLSGHVAGFLEFLRKTGRISFDVPALHGHAYLVAGASTRALVDDGILLIGDAAGLAHRQSGEGIRPAVESGLLAAKTIVDANGIYTQLKLDSYRLQIATRRESWIEKIGRFLPEQWISVLAEQLLRKRWFLQSVVLNGWFLRVESGAVE